MKKLLFVLLAVLTIASCQKKETDPGVTQQDVSFAALNVTADAGLKSTNDFPNCPDDMGVPVSAEIIINGDTYNPEVFELDGKWYTQSIKLEVAGDGPTTYQVTSFVLLDATGAIMAIPATGAAYSEYTDPNVPFDITVNKFAKAEVPVQVLCYQEADYDNFGFNWFEITQLVIREQCFFGDICLNGAPFTPADFDGSEYGTGLGVDVPAIMQVRVYKGDVIPTNEVPNSPFDNETTLGIGAPLCVQYPDNINVDGEVFTFELSLWLPDANGWSYQLYATYTATDDGPLNVDVGDDGVLDFVVGSCNYSDTDDEFDFLWEPFPPLCFNQGFETNTDDWLDANNSWYGLVTRVASGNNGITSADGSWHAIFEGDASSAPFTRFCGYSDTWNGKWIAEIDVYLDPNWTGGEGFDYTVAANGSDNNHQRDFIFHISKDISTGQLLVGGSNNSNNGPPAQQGLENGNHVVVSVAGWYTLQHVFRDDAGKLAVDLNLLDSGGAKIFTETRSDVSDLIPSVVGGNRYGWFTFINVPDGIAVDNTELFRN